MKKIFIFISTFIFISCQQNTPKIAAPFERQDEIFKYFERTNIKLDTNITHVIIFQTEKCGTCTDEVLSFVSTHFNTNEEKKIFILSSGVKKITDKLTEISNSVLVVDTNFELGRNGLSFAEDLYIKFNNKKIESWSFLNHSSIESMAH